MKNTKNGFTLIELLVVIAIIGLLSGVVLGSLSDARVKARNVQRLSDIDQINKALEIYATGGKVFPPTGADLWFCVKKTSCTSPAGATIGLMQTAPTLTTALTPNISVIPGDPTFITGFGDDYTYSSNADPDGVAGTIFTRGAYLSWVVENTGQSSSVACGRGGYLAPITSNGYQCFLRLGNQS